MTAFLKSIGVGVPSWVWLALIAGLSTLLGVSTLQRAGLKAELANCKLSAAKEVADARAGQLTELATLTKANKGLQDEYLKTESKRSDLQRRAAELKRLRDNAESEAAIAGATAGALAEHARTSERDIGRLEDDANKMADRAVRATANSEALAATLQARRAAIADAKAKLTASKLTLKPQETTP